MPTRRTFSDPQLYLRPQRPRRSQRGRRRGARRGGVPRRAAGAVRGAAEGKAWVMNNTVMEQTISIHLAKKANFKLYFFITISRTSAK